YDIAEAMGIDHDVNATLADLTMPLAQASGAAPGVVPSLALSASSTGLVTNATSDCFAQSVEQTPNNPKLVEGCSPVSLFVTAKDAATGHPLEASPVSGLTPGCSTDSGGRCSVDLVPHFPGIG